MTVAAIDPILTGAVCAWVGGLVLVVALLAHALPRPLTDRDRRLSAVDEDIRRRRALAQERAAAASLRAERRVVCELQPRRRGDRT